VDFAALLGDLEGDARAARESLLRELAEDGCTYEELARAVEEDRLLVLPAERVLRGEPRYTRDEVAERSGVSVEVMRLTRSALGLPIGEDDERAYDEEDLRVAQGLRKVLDSGVSPQAVAELNRVVGRAMVQIAAAARTMIAEATIQPGVSEADVVRAWRYAMTELNPNFELVLTWAYRSHLRELVRTEVIGSADIEAGRTAGARKVTAAFADLVGFTRLGGEVPPEQLGAVARRLEALASEVAGGPVTLVKTVGDAVMLVAPEPAPLVEAALGLLEAAEAEGQGFPQLRVGVASGTALERAGDWYGAPVNLASRLTSLARAGSVLAAEEVHEAIGDEDGVRWSFVGERKVRGVGPVKMWRARRAGADGD
jgi:adenylate cyclase